MWNRLRTIWLPRVCFTFTVGAAVVLASGVLLAPSLPFETPLLELFASDVTVRRTSLASAAALVVTACVFFRPARPKKPSPNDPPPGSMAGA